jgi:hypothetical protein
MNSTNTNRYIEANRNNPNFPPGGPISHRDIIERSSLAQDAVTRPAPRRRFRRGLCLSSTEDGRTSYQLSPDSEPVFYEGPVPDECYELFSPAPDSEARPGRSTGPRTPEGKRRSSVNAYTHGLTGQLLFHTGAEHAAWTEHSKGYFDLWKPANKPEEILVQAIADDYFRLNQGRAFESAVHATLLMTEDLDFTVPADLPDETAAALGRARNWLSKGRDIALLGLHMGRIERSIQRNTKELRQLQEERKAEEAKSLDEAIILAEMAWEEGRFYDPAIDALPNSKFVYSNNELATHATIRQRLEKGKTRKGDHPKPRIEVKKAA